MRFTRGLLLSFAILSAAGAAVIVRKTMSAAPLPPVTAAPETVELLVAGRAIAAGEKIETGDLRWQTWPSDAVPGGAATKQKNRAAPLFRPAYARFPLMEGEPVADVKLVRPDDGSHAAAVLEKGKRAVAVPIRGENAVGGLLQPFDHVDVLWTDGRESSGARPLRAQIILSAVKVIALGNSLKVDPSSGAFKTATLELTPAQARILAGARTKGDLSLALMPAGETEPLAGIDASASGKTIGERTIHIMKFGRGATTLPGGTLQ